MLKELSYRSRLSRNDADTKVWASSCVVGLGSEWTEAALDVYRNKQQCAMSLSKCARSTVLIRGGECLHCEIIWFGFAKKKTGLI